jgi:hypothetical protein
METLPQLLVKYSFPDETQHHVKRSGLNPEAIFCLLEILCGRAIFKIQFF